MGLFDRMRSHTANVPQESASTLGAGDVIPARSSGGFMERMGTQGGALAGKATDFYKQNPKLVGGVALLASALLLNRMKRPH
ncbi:MAG TPA: hypothetical protein VEC19_12400 [Usitatibacter sp.]|nr:hypothetical protein [Usitatibacter sp.]